MTALPPFHAPPAALQELRAQLRVIEDLQNIANLLEWDQATYMPPEGAEARGRQLALMGRLAHERQVSSRMRTCLENLADLAEHDTVEGALVRRARRHYERASRLPPEFVVALREHSAASYVAWTRARPAGDFASMRPYLARTLELSRRVADFYPEATHCADPLIDEADPGMTVASVRSLFTELRAQLIPFIQRIAKASTPNRDCLRGHFDRHRQLLVGREIVTRVGYDFSKGRQDETHHPFMTRFGAGDVRITTRVRDDDFTDGLFSTIHEAGHALYEQNIDPAFDGTPLGHGVSMGVHESQSRLWENMVGRSRPFWLHFFPTLQRAFPESLSHVDVDTFYGAINAVEPSLIRTDADEVTYNIHVMLRFDLEIAMLEGNLRVDDLPEAWNSRMERDLGVRPPHAGVGVLQDVHWFAGTIGGAFQGYALGNLMAAQFFEAAAQAHPAWSEDLVRGDFKPLREWLTTRVYRHGARYEADELLQQVTGRKLTIAPFMRYLEGKYTPLYDLDLHR